MLVLVVGFEIVAMKGFVTTFLSGRGGLGAVFAGGTKVTPSGEMTGNWSFKCSSAEYLEEGEGLLPEEGGSGLRTTVRLEGVVVTVQAAVSDVHVTTGGRGGTKPGGGGSFMGFSGAEANAVLLLVFVGSLREGVGTEEGE